MERLIPPPKPKIKFRLGDLKKKQVDDRVKKARAKSGPGGDGVSYNIYKYCSQLRHQLFLLLKRLWIEKTLVEEWTCAEGVYLPKEEESAKTKQFRPISTLSVGCKIYVGILATRTMEFLRSNYYINEKSRMQEYHPCLAVLSMPSQSGKLPRKPKKGKRVCQSFG